MSNDIRIAISDKRKATGSQRARLNYDKSVRVTTSKRIPAKPQQTLIEMNNNDEGDEDEPKSPRKSTNIIRIVTWINLCLVLLLIIFIAIYMATQPARYVKQAAPTLEASPSSSLSFTLIPDKDSANQHMTLSLATTNINIKQVQHFQVCCVVQKTYVCGPINKKTGVTAYLTSEKTAVVQIVSDEMIGSACKLMWFI